VQNTNPVLFPSEGDGRKHSISWPQMEAARAHHPVTQITATFEVCGFRGLLFVCLFWHHWHTSAFRSWAPGHPPGAAQPESWNDTRGDLTELMKTAMENKQHFELLDPCCCWLGCAGTTAPELCTKQGKSSRKMVYIL